MSSRRSVGRQLVIASIAAVLAACEGGNPTALPTASAALQTPEPTTSWAPASPSGRSSSAPSVPVDLSSLRWYEVRRMHDLEGIEERTLLFGSLGGVESGELALGSISFDQRLGGAEPFAWIDPQADGIFAGKALVWGRDGALGMLESIDLLSGEIRPLVETGDIIHVATADSSLAKVFFITAEETGEPTGLWVDDVTDQNDPEPIPFDFGTDPIHNFSRFRVAASADGSLLAVQRGREKVTLVEVGTGENEDVSPGGPLIGFADDYLVSLGTQSPDGTFPVMAFDLASLEGSTVFRGTVGAQIVGIGPPDIAVMTLDTTANSFDIHWVTLDSGDSASVYRGDAAINPYLARRDRTFVGYESPAGTVVLVVSFTRFIGEPAPGRELPSSANPLVLDLRSGETTILGPWDAGR